MALVADATLLKRAPSLAEVGNVAALMASDYASPMTGTVANMTCGTIMDWMTPNSRLQRTAFRRR